MNFLAAILIFIGLAMGTAYICTSLDCIGGNHAACESVAGRYGSTR